MDVFETLKIFQITPVFVNFAFTDNYHIYNNKRF